MTTGIHYHNVTKIEVGEIRKIGGTPDCPHRLATRTIKITIGGQRHDISLFADTVEELEMGK
tara:strand:- start:1313 stop:1498 length:186 start_codon:yes stop_codon:yes gene_type:complete